MKMLAALTIALVGLAAHAHFFVNYQREEALELAGFEEIEIANVCQVKKELCSEELKQKMLNRRISAYKIKGGLLIR